MDKEPFVPTDAEFRAMLERDRPGPVDLFLDCVLWGLLYVAVVGLAAVVSKVI